MGTKQTAVEWISEQLIINKIVEPANGHKFLNIMSEAKAMEKEQIMDAYYDGKHYGFKEKSEQYYEETYEKR